MKMLQFGLKTILAKKATTPRTATSTSTAAATATMSEKRQTTRHKKTKHKKMEKEKERHKVKVTKMFVCATCVVAAAAVADVRGTLTKTTIEASGNSDNGRGSSYGSANVMLTVTVKNSNVQQNAERQKS